MMRRARRSRWQIACAVAAMAALFAVGPAPVSPLAASQLEAKVLATPKRLAPFALQDHDGRPFANDRLAGGWSLVMLGFTHCPDICPFTLGNLALVLEQLSTRVSPERLPQVVFVAVDPERDRPVLAQYVQHFGDRFIGITGNDAEIKTLVDALEGYVRIARRGTGDVSYQVHHSALVSVIDPQGRIRATLAPPMDPSAAAGFLADLMRQHAREAE